jgi:hypothetical protein
MVQPVECNPEIVTLPRVMMEPLPDLPLPDPSLALIPLAAPSGGSPAGPTSWSSFVDHAGGPHSEHRCPAFRTRQVPQIESEPPRRSKLPWLS